MPVRKIDPAAYARDESWFGSYYELAMQVSSSPADEQLQAALEALWDSPRLQGPWEDRIATEKRAKLAIPAPGELRSYYGILTVDDLGELPCVVWLVREEGGLSDWLDLSIPTQALVAAGMTGLVHDAPPEFIQPLDRALAEISARVSSRAGYVRAIIGEETSGTP